jgi:hypothetical protein
MLKKKTSSGYHEKYICLMYPRFSRWVGRNHVFQSGSVGRYLLLKVESIMMLLTFPNSLSHIDEAFEFFKIYIAPTTGIGSIFIFQGTKKKKTLNFISANKIIMSGLI